MRNAIKVVTKPDGTDLRCFKPWDLLIGIEEQLLIRRIVTFQLPGSKWIRRRYLHLNIAYHLANSFERYPAKSQDRRHSVHFSDNGRLQAYRRSIAIEDVRDF